MITASNNGESTILIVEDDPLALRLVEEAVDESDRAATCLVATDGVEAFDVLYNRGEYADTPPPDFILLDLQLPGQSGQQILTEIRADKTLQLIPVIVFSSNTDPDIIAECYRLGANAYIVKPMDYVGTRAVVEQLLAFWGETAETPPE